MKIITYILNKLLGHQAWAGIGVLVAIIALIIAIYPINDLKKNIEETKKEPLSTIFQSQRIALIIGNGKYQQSDIISISRGLRVMETNNIVITPQTASSIKPLKNPINDAKDIANLLEKKGFKVILGLNLKKKEMIDLINKFQTILSLGGVGVFYFSGHAANINNNDYMLPITDKNIKDKNTFLTEAINITELLRPVEKIIEHHPKNTGTSIFYAASKGGLAFDGEGDNSPFANAIIKSIEVNNRDDGLFDIFINITKEVTKEMNGRQTPWFSSSTFSNFYFNNQRKDKNIDLMKILFVDSCRNNPFNK